MNFTKLRILFYAFVSAMITFTVCSVFSIHFLSERYDSMVNHTGPKVGLVRGMRASFSRMYLEGVSSGMSLTFAGDRKFFEQEMAELREVQEDFDSQVRTYKSLNPSLAELEGINYLEEIENDAFKAVHASLENKKTFRASDLTKLNELMEDIEHRFDATATRLEQMGRRDLQDGLANVERVHQLITWLGGLAGAFLVLMTFIIRWKTRAVLQSLQDNQAQLKEARDQAISAAKAKSAFLANMSHEIRTPMNGVIGLTNMLADSPLNQEQSENVALLQKSGEALLSIINDVLDFSKIESGHLRLEKLSFHLGTCIREAIHMVELTAKEKNIALSFNLDEKIPAYVVGDITRLRQILVNLLANAIKFTDQGRVTLTVRRHRTRHSEQVLFMIEDTGIGLKAEQKKSLFTPFTQADDSTTRRYGGTGLGLSICKNLCEAMGGRIGVRSRFGSGSIFYFAIKLPAVDSVSNAQTSSVTFKFDELLAKKFPMQILMAEDNLVNQKILQGFLSKMGYQADIAGTGQQVLEAVVMKDYDLIFMDIHMPELDGWEATRMLPGVLRPTAHAPWVLAMTASVTADDREKCRQVGMHGFLPKPVRAEDLQQAIAMAGARVNARRKSA